MRHTDITLYAVLDSMFCVVFTTLHHAQALRVATKIGGYVGVLE